MNWFHFVWFWQPCLLCNEMWCGEGLTVSINAGQSADCRGQMKVFISSGAQRSLRHDSQCLRPGIACGNLRCLPCHYSITDTDSAIYILVCMHTGRGELLSGRGGHNKRLPSARATSIVSQETSHGTWFIGGEPDEAWFFIHMMAHRKVPVCSVWCYREQMNNSSVTSFKPSARLQKEQSDRGIRLTPIRGGIWKPCRESDLCPQIV